MRQVILYELSGASKAYTVSNYFCIHEKFVSISTILEEAWRLRMRNPSIEHVFAIDNRYGLRRDYKESMKQNSIESHYIFKDILEREGMLGSVHIRASTIRAK